MDYPTTIVYVDIALLPAMLHGDFSGLDHHTARVVRRFASSHRGQTWFPADHFFALPDQQCNVTDRRTTVAPITCY